jgi:quinol monooxygenase YgiN
MTMVILQGVMSVDPDERERFLEASVAGMRSSRKETGCLEYVLAADPIDPGRVVLSERWESMDHLERHLQGQAAQRETAAGGVDARPAPLSHEITIYEVATSRPLR